MALSGSRLVVAMAALGVATRGLSACRELSVCDADAGCDDATAAGEGGVENNAGRSGGSMPDEGGAPADAGGAPGNAGEPTQIDEVGGALVGGQAGAPAGACEAGTDDCDGSTLTVCETHTSWNVRHCGGCGAVCDGACVLGRCKPSEVIRDESYPTSFVAGSAFAYALVAGQGASNIIEIALDSGETRTVGGGFSLETTLALGPDRLYALEDRALSSMPLAGNGFVTEPLAPRAIAGSADGFYYTTSVFDPQTKLATESLWYRAPSVADSVLVAEATRVEIIASNLRGVVVRRQEGTGEAKLLLVTEHWVTELGDVPLWHAAEVIPGGVAMLVPVGEDGADYELWWTTFAHGTQRYTLDDELTSPRRLVWSPEGVAMSFKENNGVYVRSYGEFGPAGVPLGIAAYTSLELLDSRYVWFTWRKSDSGVPSFRRARQLQASDQTSP